MRQVPSAEARPSASTSAGGAAAPAAPRFAWLDALRGLAALLVVFQHVGPDLLPRQAAFIHQRLDLGIFGVFLFFLISGYIVPASLERRGDVREFWLGRIFRIYPLYLAVIVAALLAMPRDHSGIAVAAFSHPFVNTVGNGLLLQFVTGGTNALSVAWTLCFEMVFYFAVSALFVMGWHRRSGPVAVAFAAVAVVAGGVLPTDLLSRTEADTRLLVGAVAVLVAGAMAGVLTGRLSAVRAGAVLLGVLGVALILVDSASQGFESMMIPATMFAGTAVHRAEKGQISRLQAGLCCALVFLAGVVSSTLYNRGSALSLTWTASWHAWCCAFVAAWAVFGLGFLLRRRAFPSPLSWLGKISYATYLIHVPMLIAMEWAFSSLHRHPHGSWQGLGCLAGFVGVLLLLGYGAHRLIELPGQKLGRRVLRGVATVPA